MRVLVLESQAGVGVPVVDRLRAGGHDVVRCDAPDRALPCRGVVSGERCPLDQRVDVAVLVQEPGTTWVEHGAICAMRDRVPVVEVTSHPELPSATPGIAAIVTTDDDVVDACRRAAADGTAHARAVTHQLVALDVVTPAELVSGDLRVRVEREPYRLRMVLTLGEAVIGRRGAIVRAAAAALRDHDPRVPVIDVVVDDVTTDAADADAATADEMIVDDGSPV
jgi:hypothetical protein